MVESKVAQLNNFNSRDQLMMCEKIVQTLHHYHCGPVSNEQLQSVPPLLVSGLLCPACLFVRRYTLTSQDLKLSHSGRRKLLSTSTEPTAEVPPCPTSKRRKRTSVLAIQNCTARKRRLAIVFVKSNTRGKSPIALIRN